MCYQRLLVNSTTSELCIANGLCIRTSVVLQFHLEQAIVRARTRIKEGRARPIDVLAANLHLTEEFDMHLDAPYSVFQGLTLADTQELHSDLLQFQVGCQTNRVLNGTGLYRPKSPCEHCRGCQPGHANASTQVAPWGTAHVHRVKLGQSRCEAMQGKATITV